MNRNTPLDPRKARRVEPPLPHPSWVPTGPVLQPKKRNMMSAEEFWERLGI